jgi:Flp pilus assembly protein TadD
MRKGPLAFLIFGLVLGVLSASPAMAQDIRIPLPKRSKPTPVQQLNRDGVKAIQKRDFNHAKKLFYRAYLIDPNDPFTLNNLGYIAELEGDLDRAQRYYALAADVSSEATVDRASNDLDEGRMVREVAGNAQDRNLRVTKLNVEAMSLLMKSRAPEADVILQKALAIDRRDAFTLNNMGYAKEQEGDLDKALSYYTAAASTRSQERVVVTANSDWRGKPISEIADRNSKKVRKLMEEIREDHEKQVAMLNLRGVSALNRNDRNEARQDFEKAYRLDPNNAFTVNNMGYLSELEGDRETAEYFYTKARESDHAGATVRTATRKDAEGHKVADVAEDSNSKVDAAMEATVEALRRQGGPVQLQHRDHSTVAPPQSPPESSPQPDANSPDASGNIQQTPPSAQPPGQLPQSGNPTQPKPPQPPIPH